MVFMDKPIEPKPDDGFLEDERMSVDKEITPVTLDDLASAMTEVVKGQQETLKKLDDFVAEWRKTQKAGKF